MLLGNCPPTLPTLLSFFRSPYLALPPLLERLEQANYTPNARLQNCGFLHGFLLYVILNDVIMAAYIY